MVMYACLWVYVCMCVYVCLCLCLRLCVCLCLCFCLSLCLSVCMYQSHFDSSSSLFLNIVLYDRVKMIVQWCARVLAAAACHPRSMPPQCQIDVHALIAEEMITTDATLGTDILWGRIAGCAGRHVTKGTCAVLLQNLILQRIPLLGNERKKVHLSQKEKCHLCQNECQRHQNQCLIRSERHKHTGGSMLNILYLIYYIINIIYIYIIY